MDLIFIDYCNYFDFPIGGHLTFAKQLTVAFDSKLKLVGLVEKREDVGKWIKKRINGSDFDYFGIDVYKKTPKRPLTPLRLKSYMAIRRYRSMIFTGEKPYNLLIQTPEVLLALHGEARINLCYRIAGLENPLKISRYKIAKPLAPLYDLLIYRLLERASIILATGDNDSIGSFLALDRKDLLKGKVIQFPTRVNLEIFKPRNKRGLRLLNGIKLDELVVVTTGRISSFKGWKFMLDAFAYFKIRFPNSRFIYIGDGEDKKLLCDYAKMLEIEQSIYVTGRLPAESVSDYLNLADVFIMGSFFEGWSTSLVEAICVGLPACVTNFSSASELVEEGVNGFVVKSRNAEEFSDKMIKSLDIEEHVLLRKVDSFRHLDISNLRKDILDRWELI